MDADRGNAADQRSRFAGNSLIAGLWRGIGMILQHDFVSDTESQTGGSLDGS